ncbi:MAG: TonB family protein, partial [Burkholderiales bacterium]|nr:TonB family protein [Burkholderiales bacterium]
APVAAKAAPSASPAVPAAPAAAAARKPEPAPAPVVAKAAPVEQPSRVLARVDPDFPSEALREGYDGGVVKVRLAVDAEGNVTRVDIVEAKPRRVFDRAVTNALSQWKFNAGKAGRAVETEIVFRR